MPYSIKYKIPIIYTIYILIKYKKSKTLCNNNSSYFKNEKHNESQEDYEGYKRYYLNLDS